MLSNFFKKLAHLLSFKRKRLGLREPVQVLSIFAKGQDLGSMGDAMAADFALASKLKSG
jgi:hypothetical protein